MNAAEQMKKFVEPESVVLFGVSRRTEEGTYNILKNLLNYGYQGRIYPVNPNATEILGVKTYPRIADIEDSKLDLAVINLPRSLVPRIIKECIERNVKSIIIVTQGFNDANDKEGKQLQKEIDELIKKNGVRVLGPNSLGTANAFINFSSSFTRLTMVKVPIGIICQTGAFFALPELRLLGKAIDPGNSCDLDVTDSLEFFEQDDQVNVIAMHIEGTKDGKRFLDVAGRTTRKKPIVALKAGRSEYAARAAQSHTGSMVGKDEVWDAAFRQSGIIRVSDMEEFSDAARAFSLLPLMAGKRIGIISTSGGVGIMSIDACHKYNLEIARFSPRTLKRINTWSPSWQNVGNPADMWPAIMVSDQPQIKVLSDTADAILSDDCVDSTLLVWWVQTHQICAEFCQVFEELTGVHKNKPLVFSLHGRYAEEVKRKLEPGSRIIDFYSPDRAIRALGHLARYSEFRRRL